MGCHFLLQGILSTQGSNPHLLMHLWITGPISCPAPAMTSHQEQAVLSLICIGMPGPRTPSDKILWTCCNHACSIPLPIAMEIILLSGTTVESICKRSIVHCVGTASAHRTTNYINSRKQCFLLFFWSVIIERYNRKCSSAHVPLSGRNARLLPTVSYVLLVTNPILSHPRQRIPSVSERDVSHK